MLTHHRLPLSLLPTMVATTSLQTVHLAENRRWYHCKCVRVKRLLQKAKENSLVSLSNLASPLSFSTGIIVASMLVITKNLKRKQIFIMYTFKASRLELASLLSGGRDSLGSSRTHRFFSMIAADVVWHPNCSFALLARLLRSRVRN